MMDVIMQVYMTQPTFEALTEEISPNMHPIQHTNKAAMVAVTTDALVDVKSFTFMSCRVKKGMIHETHSDLRRVLPSGKMTPEGILGMFGQNPSVQSKMPVMNLIDVM